MKAKSPAQNWIQKEFALIGVGNATNESAISQILIAALERR